MAHTPRSTPKPDPSKGPRARPIQPLRGLLVAIAASAVALGAPGDGSWRPGSLAALIAPAPLAAAQDAPAPDLSPEHEAIAFLIGSWRTESELPDGSTAPGDLRYEWVLGGGWMHVRFVGDHPTVAVWEAVAMQRWNPDEGEYESWSFPQNGPPVRYRGTVPEPGLFRIERTDEEGGRSGIDYRALDDGTVYQENWVVPSGEERRVTLRTQYEPERSLPNTTPPRRPTPK